MTQFVECQVCQHTISAGDRHCSYCGAEVHAVPQDPPAQTSDTSDLLELLQRATIGEYEIREELGRGGMAVVYLAHEIRFGRKVALKVLAPHLQLLQGMPARFLREAQTAANLEHPNIIPIYAYRESKDFAFFTMRFVAGAPLSAIARQLERLPVQVVRALLADIGSALGFAHQHGVMHRDVKPGNVLIGRDGAVIVTDFGIAKQAEVAGLTLTGQLLGTPRYMSPEQCRGHEVTPASDQYSLGTLAYELLAGQPPFVGANAMDIMAKQMLDPVPDVRTFRPDCPPELADALTRMLAKAPHDRFPSIDDALLAAQAMPVLPNDPVRLQLRAWVSSPVHERNYAITPISPTPRAPDSGKAVLTPLSVPSAPSVPVDHPAAATRATPPPTVHQSDSSADASVAEEAPPAPEVRVTPAHAAAPGAHAASARERGESTASRNAETLPIVARPSDTGRWVRYGLAGAVALVAVVLVARWGGDPSRPLPPPPPPPLPATLTLSGLPDDAGIEVDGRPASGPRLELEPGRHTLRLTAPGFATVDTVVQLVAGTSQTVAFVAQPIAPPAPAVGTLLVRQLPSGATIRIDGERASGSRFELPEGRHTVRIEAPDYSAFERSVNVVGGESQTLNFAGQQIAAPSPVRPPVAAERGVLLLRVRPFARIYVDDRLVKEDAILTQPLTAGSHRLRFEKDGFVTRDTSVEMRGGDTLKVAIVLEPKAK